MADELRNRIHRLQAQLETTRDELNRAESEFNTLHNAEVEAQRNTIMERLKAIKAPEGATIELLDCPPEIAVRRTNNRMQLLHCSFGSFAAPNLNVMVDMTQFNILQNQRMIEQYTTDNSILSQILEQIK